jgi:hypothetical protein
VHNVKRNLHFYDRFNLGIAQARCDRRAALEPHDALPAAREVEDTRIERRVVDDDVCLVQAPDVPHHEQVWIIGRNADEAHMACVALRAEQRAVERLAHLGLVARQNARAALSGMARDTRSRNSPAKMASHP